MDEYIINRIEEMHDDIKEIKVDLKSTTHKLYDETTLLRLAQQKCDGHWSLIRTLLGLGGFGTIAVWISKFFTG